MKVLNEKLSIGMSYVRIDIGIIFVVVSGLLYSSLVAEKLSIRVTNLLSLLHLSCMSEKAKKSMLTSVQGPLFNPNVLNIFDE